MTLLVYGVVPDGTAVPHTRGVADGALSTVPLAGVAAVVSPLPTDQALAGRGDLTTYHDVLNDLAERGPVIPFRFGSALPDEPSVVNELLAPRSEELAALLETLVGRCQLTLRARWVQEAVLAEIAAADPQIRALSARTRDLPEEASWHDRVRLGELVARALDHKRDDAAAALLDLVLPHVVEHRERAASGTDGFLDAALLVDEDRRSALEGVLETYAEANHDRVRVKLLGPLPPYDFVGGG